MPDQRLAPVAGAEGIIDDRSEEMLGRTRLLHEAIIGLLERMGDSWIDRIGDPGPGQLEILELGDAMEGPGMSRALLRLILLGVARQAACRAGIWCRVRSRRVFIGERASFLEGNQSLRYGTLLQVGPAQEPRRFRIRCLGEDELELAAGFRGLPCMEQGSSQILPGAARAGLPVPS